MLTMTAGILFQMNRASAPTITANTMYAWFIVPLGYRAVQSAWRGPQVACFEVETVGALLQSDCAIPDIICSGDIAQVSHTSTRSNEAFLVDACLGAGASFAALTTRDAR
jgi:hypothetical protein